MKIALVGSGPRSIFNKYPRAEALFSLRGTRSIGLRILSLLCSCYLCMMFGWMLGGGE